jgi:hypothetical protein
MKRFSSRVFCLAFLATAMAHASTITSGTSSATFTDSATSFDTTPTANFTVGGFAGDQVFEFGWWLRQATDSGQLTFGEPTSFIAAGNQVTYTWAALPGGLSSLSATLTYIVVEALGITSLTSELTLTNNGATAIALVAYSMTDIDLGGTGAGDSATGGLGGIAVTDPGTALSLNFYGTGASSYLVRAFNATTDVAGILSAAAAANFDNSGLPFGPGDFTGGFQWNGISLAGGGSISLTSGITNGPLSGGEVPEPGTLSLVGLGLAGVALLRRRG